MKHIAISAIMQPMDEDQAYFPDTSGKHKEASFWKTMFFSLVGILIVAGVAGGAYLIGTRSGGGTKTTTLTPTETSVLSDNTTSEPTNEPITTPETTSLTPTKEPVTKTKILSATAALDGFRSSNGGGNSGIDIRVGRNTNLVARGFVSFDISDLPAGAKVYQATLRLYQTKVVGKPYTYGGQLKIDHLTYGDSLDDTDYASPSLLSGFDSLSKSDAVEWKELEVTDEVKDDISNARNVTQYRIHFTYEDAGGDVNGDFAYFESAENTGKTNNTPELVIKYY